MKKITLVKIAMIVIVIGGLVAFTLKDLVYLDPPEAVSIVHYSPIYWESPLK